MLAVLLAVLLPAFPAAPGKLLVVNKPQARVSVIDLGTGKVIRTIPTGKDPHEVAVSPDGKTAVVGNYGAQQPGQSLTIFDLTDGRVLHTVELGEYKRPHGVQWLDQDRLVATAEAADSIVIVNARIGKVASSIKTDKKGSHMVVLAPDRTRAYTADVGSGTLSVLDLAKSEKEGETEAGQGCEGIAISPDGKTLITTNRGEATVSIIDARSLKVTKKVKTGAVPIRAAFTPDGKKILICAAEGGEVLILDGKSFGEVGRAKLSPTQFEKGPAPVPIPMAVAVHPQGRYAYIGVVTSDAVAVLDLTSHRIVGRIEANGFCDGLAVAK